MSNPGKPLAYALPRDAAESVRLDLQHKVITTNLGYLLHSSITSTLPDDARIADVATGTGVWLNDFAGANQDKSYKYTGFDISPKQFPAKHLESISFAELDMLQPIPEHLIGIFDLVHVRLLLCAFKSDDWAIATRNLIEMLKPGGWLQWGDASHCCVVQNVSIPNGCALRRLTDSAVAANQGQGRMLVDPTILPGVFKEQGLLEVTSDLFSSDGKLECRADWTRTQLNGVAASFRALAASGGSAAIGMDSDGIEDLVADCEEELKRGDAYCRADFIIAVGRKAR